MKNEVKIMLNKRVVSYMIVMMWTKYRHRIPLCRSCLCDKQLLICNKGMGVGLQASNPAKLALDEHGLTHTTLKILHRAPKSKLLCL